MTSSQCLTPKEDASLDRCMDRIAAGISVFQRHGHPAKPQGRRDMDVLIEPYLVPHPMQTHHAIHTYP